MSKYTIENADMIPEEDREEVIKLLQNLAEELETGEVVNIHMKCDDCGAEWTTPLNSKNGDAAMVCLCKIVKEYGEGEDNRETQ